MSLSMILDPPTRLILEPGYDHVFSGAAVAQEGMPADNYSAENLWHDPAAGVIMLKPRQLDPNFLNHAAQVSTGAVQELGFGLFANPIDITNKTIYTVNVGSAANPWVYHTPVALALPLSGRSPLGITPSYTLTDIYNTSEGAFLLVPLVDSQGRFEVNAGVCFRWYVPRFDLTLFPTVYGITVGQYLLILRETQVEVYEDISPHGDRGRWYRVHSYKLFGNAAPQANPATGNWQWGQFTPPGTSEDTEHYLLMLPYARNRVLLLADNLSYGLINVRNQPRLLSDSSDWDILRSDSIQVWATSSVPGRFQLQQVVYPTGTATLNLAEFQTEYTPVGPPIGSAPVATAYSDVFHGSTLVSTLQSPPLYTFPTSPTDNDCPKPAVEGSGQFSTYGCSLAFKSDPTHLYTPQFYALKFHIEPVFMDNPSPAKRVGDSQPGPTLLSAEVSAGTKPGDGRLHAIVMDFSPGYPLAGYYDRAEMPVQLLHDSTAVFTGYTNRLTHRPLRQKGAPVELTFTADDRWLLLETSYLRDQDDYRNTGHITVVDKIARQCGIDTTNPPAEYPAGWNGAMASVYNTPLSITQDLSDAQTLTDQALLGWKPQPFDTGASFLRRIVDYYSGWLLGFRLDGALYYLPYYYFNSPSVTFYPRGSQGTPVYRSPVEFRVIEPTGNVVQASSHYLQDYTYNRSGLYVDWASVRNPKAQNYLGRYKWFVEEVNGAFNCTMMNGMAWITFQRSRFRRKRVVFEADFVPTLKIGQVFTLTGYGDYRLLELSARLLKGNWEIATYTGEEVIPDYTTIHAGTTGGEAVREFTQSLHESSRQTVREQLQQRAIQSPPPGRFLQTNTPFSGNPKARTKRGFTTGYDPVKGTTTVPFTPDRSLIGGGDIVTD